MTKPRREIVPPRPDTPLTGVRIPRDADLESPEARARIADMARTMQRRFKLHGEQDMRRAAGIDLAMRPGHELARQMRDMRAAGVDPMVDSVYFRYCQAMDELEAARSEEVTETLPCPPNDTVSMWLQIAIGVVLGLAAYVAVDAIIAARWL